MKNITALFIRQLPIYLFLILFFIACGIPIKTPPPQVIEAFKNKYPAISMDSVLWNLDGNGNYEAKFTMDNRKYRADILPTGKWLETETNIELSEAPEAVQLLVKEKYNVDYLDEIEMVDDHEKGMYYDVEFHNGINRVDIEINAEGKIIGTQR